MRTSPEGWACVVERSRSVTLASSAHLLQIARPRPHERGPKRWSSRVEAPPRNHRVMPITLETRVERARMRPDPPPPPPYAIESGDRGARLIAPDALPYYMNNFLSANMKKYFSFLTPRGCIGQSSVWRGKSLRRGVTRTRHAYGTVLLLTLSTVRIYRSCHRPTMTP